MNKCEERTCTGKGDARVSVTGISPEYTRWGKGKYIPGFQRNAVKEENRSNTKHVVKGEVAEDVIPKGKWDENLAKYNSENLSSRLFPDEVL